MTEAPKYTSLFKQHLSPDYGAGRYANFTAEGDARFKLARMFYNKAVASNANIATLIHAADEAQASWELGMESSYRPYTEHKVEIDELAKKITAGEIPMPRFTPEEDIKVIIAGRKVELQKAQKAADKALTEFEEQFFKTAEGQQYKAYIEAAAKNDYSAFLKEYPAKEAEKIAEKTAKAAEETVAKSKGWVAKFSEMGMGGKTAIIGGTVALGGALGYWAFKSKNNNQSQQTNSPQK